MPADLPPTFSIITPNFNSGLKLEATIASLNAQRVRLEYLILDGGSGDQSPDVARQAAKQLHHPFSFVSGRDKGIYDAMNKGIALANGRYFLFMGAGDTLVPNSLESVRELLPDNDRSFVYGDVIFRGSRYDGPFDKRKLCLRNIGHQAIFYGREVFSLIGSYNLRYRHLADWEFNMRCFGASRIPKVYVDVVISNFEDGGVGWQPDELFSADRLALIRKWLGLNTYIRHRLPHLGARIHSIAARIAKP